MERPVIKTRSATVWIDGKTVIKKYNAQHRKLFERECAWFSRLGARPYLPAVLGLSADELTIRTSYAGEPICGENAPSDWKEQLGAVVRDLGAANCHHGDLTPPNILVRDGRLSIVDLGQAATLDAVGKTKKRTLADSCAIKRVNCLMNGISRGAEVHVFVIWDRENCDPLEQAISERLDIVDKVFLSAQVYRDHFGDRATWVKHFYNVRHLSGSKKGNMPFAALVVLSKNPCYLPRRKIFTSEKRVVNTEIFDLKEKLRKGREGFLHSSDNQEEARRNLHYLSYNEDALPYGYLTAARPQFTDIEQAFAALNELSGVRYVLLRKPDEGATGEDYDILCDDYFAVKRTLGGVSYKTHGRRLFSNVGAPVDEGGFKVANRVLVANKKVPFDIRFVGDGYFPAAWQRKILERRTMHEGVYVCAPEDAYYTTAYHALFHKAAMPDKYARHFGTALGLTNKAEIAARLRTQVLDYLQAHAYSATRPRDVTMPFVPPATTRFGMCRELYFMRREFGQANWAGGSRVLHNLLRCNRPDLRTTVGLLVIVTGSAQRFAGESAARLMHQARRQLSKVKRRLAPMRVATIGGSPGK